MCRPHLSLNSNKLKIYFRYNGKFKYRLDIRSLYLQVNAEVFSGDIIQCQRCILN